jgi:transposase
MVATFNLNLSGLVLDMTNFATYIDSRNERAPIAQRGHPKQKRNDLRLVGLGLVVSTDGEVPLLSHSYPGNRHDATQFADVLAELVTRSGALAENTDQLTLVYDAGQNSEVNQNAVASSPLHFVGSLAPAQHRELLAPPLTRYRVVDAERSGGLRAFETRVAALGVTTEYSLPTRTLCTRSSIAGSTRPSRRSLVD